MPFANLATPPTSPHASASGVATLTFPLRVRLGVGARAELAGGLARLGVTRPLVVTDPGLEATGLVAEVVGRLGVGPGAEVAVFSGVEANPDEASVLAGL